MPGYLELDALASNRYGVNARMIEMEKALEGAHLDAPVKGIRRQVLNIGRRPFSFDWTRTFLIDRRAA